MKRTADDLHRPAGTADQTAVQANAHHSRPARLALGVERVERVPEIGEKLVAGIETLRRIQHHFLKRAAAREHVRQRQSRREPEEHVDVGQPEVAVEQHDFLAARGQRRGEIDRHRGLADATLAAGDGDDLHGIRLPRIRVGVTYGHCALLTYAAA